MFTVDDVKIVDKDFIVCGPDYDIKIDDILYNFNYWMEKLSEKSWITEEILDRIYFLVIKHWKEAL